MKVALLMAATSVHADGDVTPRVPQESATPGQCRQWLVLLAFALGSSFNAFLCMNFAVVSELTQEVLDVQEDAVAWLYSGMLLAVFAGMPVGLLLVIWWEGAGLFLTASMNMLCALVRWFGVKRRAYSFCLFSALLNGVGAWTILPEPAQLSQQRFPPMKWTFTTSLAVQANYAGWMLGSFLVPLVVKDEETMERFLVYQVSFAVFAVVVYLFCYRPVAHRQPLAENTGAETAADEDAHDLRGVQELLATIKNNPSFSVQVLCYGLLGGISFAVPGCNDAILSQLGFPSKITAYVNIAFIGTGVIGGLLLGYKCNNPRCYGHVLRTIFFMSVVAFTSLAVFLRLGQPDPDNNIHLVVIFLLSMIAGATSIGFIGIGIQAAALYPVRGTFVCFSVELFVQLVGGVLTQLSSSKDGYTSISAAAWLAAIPLLAGYRQPVGSRAQGAL